MRYAAAYALIVYGLFTVASAGSSVRHGQLAPAGGLVLAIVGITMIFAALGMLLGLTLAIAVAIASVVAASLLALYNAYVLDGHIRAGQHVARTLLAAALITSIVVGD